MNYLFKSIRELSRLPFYSLNEQGEIILKKGVVDYKIIDSHTHLAWNYQVGKPINLWKQGRVNYCYPTDAIIYLNRHGALDMGNKLNHKEKEIFSGVVDLKKYSVTYTIPNILHEMDNLGVDKAVVLCLKIPLMANNTSHVLKNVFSDENVKNRLLVFGSLSPRGVNKKSKIDHWVKRGIGGIKLHPLFNFFKPNSKGCYRICKQAERHSLPILFHTGLSPAAPQYLKKFVNIKDFEQTVSDFPKVNFILGHGGGFPDWEASIAISRKYDNVYLETSGQPPQVIAEFVKRCDNDRLLYGSDWPFYPMALCLAKTLLGTEKNRKVREKILFKNASKLLSL